MNASTRPRITFDKNGFCNACQWAEEKKTINWKKRQSLLKKIFSKKKYNYDCIVPVSGGKDGSYISYMLKKKFKINPLCVTVRPPLELDLLEPLSPMTPPAGGVPPRSAQMAPPRRSASPATQARINEIRVRIENK